MHATDINELHRTDDAERPSIASYTCKAPNEDVNVPGYQLLLWTCCLLVLPQPLAASLPSCTVCLLDINQKGPPAWGGEHTLAVAAL